MVIDSNIYLPSNLKNNEVMLKVTSMLNALISNNEDNFNSIFTAFNDIKYKYLDFTKVSYDSKLLIIQDMGMSYITDIFTFSDYELSNFMIFLQLIFALKGKTEGLKLILDLTNINYNYVLWTETSPKGRPFTATLTIYVSEDINTNDFLLKLRKFIRKYTFPLTTIIIVQVATFNNMNLYYSAGFCSKMIDENEYDFVATV